MINILEELCCFSIDIATISYAHGASSNFKHGILVLLKVLTSGFFAYINV